MTGALIFYFGDPPFGHLARSLWGNYHPNFFCSAQSKPPHPHPFQMMAMAHRRAMRVNCRLNAHYYPSPSCSIILISASRQALFQTILWGFLQKVGLIINYRKRFLISNFLILFWKIFWKKKQEKKRKKQVSYNRILITDEATFLIMFSLPVIKSFPIWRTDMLELFNSWARSPPPLTPELC